MVTSVLGPKTESIGPGRMGKGKLGSVGGAVWSCKLCGGIS